MANINNTGYLQIELSDQNPLDLNPTFVSNSSSCVQFFNYAYCNCDMMDIAHLQVIADDLENATNAFNALTSLNFTTSPQPPFYNLIDGSVDHKWDVLNAIAGNTSVFFISTHAEFDTNVGQTKFYAPDNVTQVFSSDVDVAMSNKQQNNNVVPFYNFVFIDGCESALFTDMA